MDNVSGQVGVGGGTCVAVQSHMTTMCSRQFPKLLGYGWLDEQPKDLSNRNRGGHAMHAGRR